MKHSITAIALLSLVVAWGCSAEPEPGLVPEDQSVEFPAGSQATPAPSIPEVPAAPAVQSAEGSVTGELAEVDPSDGTFRLLLDDGTSSAFRYTELTAVTGANDTQGLATRSGMRATVHFDTSTDPPTATNIEIVP